MSAKKIKYSMPRGDSRTLPIAIPLTTYSVGASLFFGMKTVVDNVLDDSTAVLRKVLTDTNITSTDATTVHYLLTLAPSDTNTIAPDTYLAEIEFVSADKQTVITFPDPSQMIWEFIITGDVNRRTA